MTVLRDSDVRGIDRAAREFLVTLALVVVVVGAPFGISRLVDRESTAAPSVSPPSASYFVPETEPRPTDRYSAPRTTLAPTDRYTAPDSRLGRFEGMRP